MEVGGEGVIHLSLHCHHQDDFCTKLGAILMFHNNIVRDKVTRQCLQTIMFEVKEEPKQIRTEVPLFTSLAPYR